MSYRDRSRRPSLIIRNLPLDTRKSEVEDLFNKYGQIRDVYLPLNHYTRKFQGFGFVEFYDMRDAEDAQEELDNKIFGGRTLEVKWSRDDRKTPREMIRREHDRDQPSRGGDYGRGGDYRGGGGYEGDRRRRSYSPSPRRDYVRSPKGYRSPPPRSPIAHDRDRDIVRDDRQTPPPEYDASPRREASRSPVRD